MTEAERKERIRQKNKRYRAACKKKPEEYNEERQRGYKDAWAGAKSNELLRIKL